MLTTNINTEDRLINGKMGTLKHEKKKKKNEIKAMHSGLDKKCAGQIRMSGNDVIAKNNRWDPIKREKTSIYPSK